MVLEYWGLGHLRGQRGTELVEGEGEAELGGNLGLGQRGRKAEVAEVV